MCGISGIVGPNWQETQLDSMIQIMHHRGPDANGKFISPDHKVGLGHNRLSILDLSDAGKQPMESASGRYILVFNGEIYNYKELYEELAGYPFKSKSDSEVLLAAFEKWGIHCLNKLAGMFAFAIWDNAEQTLYGIRDRFGVKPFHFAQDQKGNFYFASEIKALHAAGTPKSANEAAWANYLVYGLYDHDDQTFWKHINKLPGGHFLKWHGGQLETRQWYRFEERIADTWDSRKEREVKDEYLTLLQESIKFRFRADVPVGINLSGGLDSSILLGLVDQYKGPANELVAFTFATGDARYDELPWAKEMLAHTQHPHEVCYLKPTEVPALCQKIQQTQDEPFGGFPTIAYSKVFERAREMGILVLLDGQGMDEQWAGYEYYHKYLQMEAIAPGAIATGPVQASRSSTFKVDCLLPEFADCAKPMTMPIPFPDALRNIQYRDTFYSKIPRALRFNDRISMMYSTELREPFLDHRLFELAFQQPDYLKIQGKTHKWLLRGLVDEVLPRTVSRAPKRPLQTPQREWLANELREWTNDCITDMLQQYGGIWVDTKKVRQAWDNYQKDKPDNSFFIWQWISLSLVQ